MPNSPTHPPRPYHRFLRPNEQLVGQIHSVRVKLPKARGDKIEVFAMYSGIVRVVDTDTNEVLAESGSRPALGAVEGEG
jgi:hypothetical protein